MHRKRRLTVAVTFFLLASASLGRAENWPRFRGTDGAGNAHADLPVQWSEKDYRWKIDLPAGGHSSPVVWGDRVFVTCADDRSAERIVLCVDAKDGHVLWKRQFSSHSFREHGDNSYASATPAVDADHVYVSWNTPEELTLLALDHDGKDVWNASLGPFISQHGGGSSPVVFEDIVLMGDDNEGQQSFIFGVDRNTGQTKWKIARKSDKFAASTPCLFQPHEGAAQAIFTDKSEGVTAVNPNTGAILWSLPEVFDARTVSSPAPGNGLIVATCGEGAGGHVLIAAKPGDVPQPAAIAYSLKAMTPYVPTPLIHGDLLFYLADSGTLTCAKADTGKTVWQERIGGSFYSSPVCDGEHLVCVSKKGEVIFVSATEKFAVLGRNSLSEKCHATPAIAGGDLFVRTYTHLYCIAGKPTKP